MNGHSWQKVKHFMPHMLQLWMFWSTKVNHKIFNISLFFYWFCLDVQVGLYTVKMVRKITLALSSVFDPGREVQSSILILVCVKPISFGSYSSESTPKENLSHGRAAFSVRLEVGVSLLLAPAGPDKRAPKAPFPLVGYAGIQPAICRRVPAGALAGAGSYWKHWLSMFDGPLILQANWPVADTIDP